MEAVHIKPAPVERPTARHRSRMVRLRSAARPGLARLSLFAFALILSLALGEAYLRVSGFTPTYVNPLGSFHEFDPQIGHRGKADFTANFKRPEFDVRVAHDNYGFRNQMVPSGESTAATVYVLGDSFTWGWGVQKPYTLHLADALADRRVYNLGISATGTVQQFAIFQRFVEDRLSRRDAVVLAVYCNDFKDNLGLLNDNALHAIVERGTVREIAPPVESRCSRLWEHARRHSCLINLMGYLGNEWRFVQCRQRALAQASLTRGDREFPPVPDFPESSPEYLVFRTYLEKFRAACANRGVPFVVMYIPGRSAYRESGIEGEDVPVQQQAACRRAIHQVCDELHVPLCDLTQTLIAAKSRDPQRRLTFEYDFHWNERGHEVAGDALARFLARELALQPAARPMSESRRSTSMSTVSRQTFNRARDD